MKHWYIGIPVGLLLGYPFSSAYDYLNPDLRPVVSQMEVVASYEKNQNTYIRVFGNKDRDCGPPLSITGKYGSQQLYQITFLDDKTEEGLEVPDAQPVGEQIDFGWWELIPSPDIDTVLFITYHDCNGDIIESPFNLQVRNGEK